MTHSNQSIQTYDFVIDHDGRQYQCRRVVTGKRVLYQTVYVEVCGHKDDGVSYGRSQHPADTMEGIAELIAHELVEDRKRSSQI